MPWNQFGRRAADALIVAGAMAVLFGASQSVMAQLPPCETCQVNPQGTSCGPCPLYNPPPTGCSTAGQPRSCQGTQGSGTTCSVTVFNCGVLNDCSTGKPVQPVQYCNGFLATCFTNNGQMCQ